MSKPGRKSALRSFFTFAVLVLLIVGLLLLLSGEKAPSIPDDSFHEGLDFDVQCGECHTPDGEAPLRDEHPPKEQCLECH